MTIRTIDPASLSHPPLRVIGLYPGLSAQDLMAPSSTASPDVGRWAYDFSDPDGPQMGTVALPGSEIVHYAVDPVVVIASNKALGVELYGEDVEVRSPHPLSHHTCCQGNRGKCGV